jgi:F-type H+-transporting ATPase subunit b
MRIDWWTLALQTVNVLVLVWLLARFFFKPVANIVAKREEMARKALADAAAARQDVDKARGEAEQARAGIAAERERLIAEAETAAQAERAALLARTTDELARMRADAEAALARDRAAAEEALIDRAGELSITIARRLLERTPPATTFNAFLDELCSEIRALSPQMRAAFNSPSDGDSGIELVTAAPLTAQEGERTRHAIEAALGATLRHVAFRTDPSLVAGVELRSPHAVVRTSWGNDLERIREELKRDSKQPEQAGRLAQTGEEDRRDDKADPDH